MTPQENEDQLDGQKLAIEFTRLAEFNSPAFRKGVALHLRAYADSVLGPKPDKPRAATNQEEGDRP